MSQQQNKLYVDSYKVKLCHYCRHFVSMFKVP